MRKNTLVVFLLIIVLGIATAASMKMHLVRNDSGCSVIWKSDEAYIVASGGSRGYRFRYITFPWIVLKEFLNAPAFPDERRVSDIVIRITPSSVERQEVDFGTNTGSIPDFVTPFEDGLYALCPGVVLCKWNGKGFQRATEEEEKRIGGIDGLNKDPRKNAINGWNVRRFPYSPSEHFEIQLGENLTITAKNQTTDERARPNISVDLVRSGQVPQNLYNVDGALRRVSESEYKRTFGDTHSVGE